MASDHHHAAPVLVLLLLMVTAQSQPTPPSNSNNNNNNNSNYGFPSGNFSSSTAVVVAILVSAFFFLAFFSIYIRQCSLGRSPTTRTANLSAAVLAAAARRSRRTRGLDQSILDTFPTFAYSEVKDLKIGKETLECAVCLSEFSDDETLRLLPACNHVFHPECIDVWLGSHVSCPICRTNLAVAPARQIAYDDATDQEDDVAPTDHVAISVAEAEVARPARFSRSHTTGHVRAGDERERYYRLRLPEQGGRGRGSGSGRPASTALVAVPDRGRRRLMTMSLLQCRLLLGCDCSSLKMTWQLRRGIRRDD